MKIVRTTKTAALAGIWTMFGLVPFNAWVEARIGTEGALPYVLWALALAVFLFVPGFVLVLGMDAESRNPFWYRDPVERARQMEVFKRLLAWFLGAALMLVVWKVLFMTVLNPESAH